MGMYDYLRSGYDLGEAFTNVPCQTKDIEEWGIGGTMTHFWLDPAGRLWCPFYKDTHTLEIISEDDERYNPKITFLNFEWLPTGKHGVFKTHEITKYIEIYPENFKGNWYDRPRLQLHFRQGILQDFSPLS